MDIGEVFDWVGRIFGIAFLLFMLYVLFFPDFAEPADETDQLIDERHERADPPVRPSQPELAPRSRQVQDRGRVLTFPQHRRVQR